MSLKLMYITNRPDIVCVAEEAGVDRIFVDREFIGKNERQSRLNTVKNHHSIEDVAAVRKVITKAGLLVRCNPWHEASTEYESSEEEIEKTIQAGADIIMLPFFKTVEEVKSFIAAVGKRARTMLLFETPQAVEKIDEILALDGIDEVFIGLNDLSIGYGKKFLFELLSDGTVERICHKFKEASLPYGFGGIASVGKGMLPSEKIIREHYRLGSTCVILSRSFCNLGEMTDMAKIRSVFMKGIEEIRNQEEQCRRAEVDFAVNKKEIAEIVRQIVRDNG